MHFIECRVVQFHLGQAEYDLRWLSAPHPADIFAHEAHQWAAREFLVSGVKPLAVGDRVALHGGYDGYPSWDHSGESCEERQRRRWQGTVIAVIDDEDGEPSIVVRMDEILLARYDTTVLSLRHVGTTWKCLPVIAGVCLTNEAEGIEGWKKSFTLCYVEAAATVEHVRSEPGGMATRDGSP